VEATIKSTAELDGKDVIVGLSRDPGQAGKFESAYYIRALQGFRVIAAPESGDKITRAGPISSQALAGNVYIVRGKWNDVWMRELEQFPEGAHDDQVDSLSGGHALLISNQTFPPRRIIPGTAFA
jgi:predicted phage terminase large subunit-like protein